MIGYNCSRLQLCVFSCWLDATTTDRCGGSEEQYKECSVAPVCACESVDTAISNASITDTKFRAIKKVLMSLLRLCNAAWPSRSVSTKADRHPRDECSHTPRSMAIQPQPVDRSVPLGACGARQHFSCRRREQRDSRLLWTFVVTQTSICGSLSRLSLKHSTGTCAVILTIT